MNRLLPGVSPMPFRLVPHCVLGEGEGFLTEMPTALRASKSGWSRLKVCWLGRLGSSKVVRKV